MSTIRSQFPTTIVSRYHKWSTTNALNTYAMQYLQMPKQLLKNQCFPIKLTKLDKVTTRKWALTAQKLKPNENSILRDIYSNIGPPQVKSSGIAFTRSWVIEKAMEHNTMRTALRHTMNLIIENYLNSQIASLPIPFLKSEMMMMASWILKSALSCMETETPATSDKGGTWLWSACFCPS